MGRGEHDRRSDATPATGERRARRGGKGRRAAVWWWRLGRGSRSEGFDWRDGLQPIMEETAGNRDTKMSIASSSSILPPSTSSSSSSASLAAPYLSDSATSPLTSETYATNQTSPPTPHSPTRDAYGHVKHVKRVQPPPLASLKRPSTANAIMASSPFTPQAHSSSRPDTPMDQMYTGLHVQQGRQPVSPPSALANGFDLRGDEPHSRSQSSPQIHPSWSYNTALPQKPSLRRNLSDARRGLSPALPDSPFIQGQGSSDGRSGVVPMTPLSQLSESRPESHVSEMDLAEDDDAGRSVRSTTPSGSGVRSVVNGHRSPTQASHSHSLSAASRTSSHKHNRSQSSSGFSHDDRDHEPTARVNISGALYQRRPSAGAKSPPLKPILVQSPTLSSIQAIQARGGTPRTLSTNPLLLQPAFNSSRSSLVSAGSSFHSSEDGHGPLSDLERTLSSRRKESTQVDADDEPTESDQEDLLSCWGSVGRNELAFIHDKLVKAALDRPAPTVSAAAAPAAPPFQPFATRSPSRHKRRASEFSVQSFTLNEVRPPFTCMESTGPDMPSSQQPSQPSSSTPPRPVSPPQKDNASKANELLRSMMDSLNTSLPPPTSFMPSPSSSGNETPLDPQFAPGLATTSSEDSASALKGVAKRSPVPSFNDPDTRKKALTEALFGDPTSPLVPSTSAAETRQHPYNRADLTLEDLRPVPKKPSLTFQPKSPDEDLIAEITRRNASATEALKSPTIARSESMLRRQGTKRINARLISSPQLVSSTTSVDVVPVVPVDAQSQTSTTNGSTSPALDKAGNKLSLRLKKLREKLKTRPSLPNGEEITPWTYDARSPSPASSSAHVVPSPAQTVERSTQPSPSPAATSASGNDINGFRFPSPSLAVTSPSSATAQSGLKGLMSRLRSNSRRELSEANSVDSHDSRDRSQPPSQHSHSSPSRANETLQPAHVLEPPRRQPPPLRTTSSDTPDIIDLTSPREEGETMRFDLSTPPPAEPEPDSAALRQLFDAASSLGLDQAALQNLVRSTSSSSRSTNWTAMTRSNSVNTPATTVAHTSRDSSKLFIGGGEGLKRSASSRTPVPLSRVLEQPGGLTPSPILGGQTIVRRTIIFPSESEGALTRKASTATKTNKRKNRASMQSVQSGRSVQERIPTPPPNRGSRRFSKDQSPPLPSLPPSFSFNGRDSAPSPPTSPMKMSHKSQASNSSAYGSL